MPKFKIVTSCEAITEYIVEAATPQEAEEQFTDGNYESENITDFHNEEIIKTEEVKL